MKIIPDFIRRFFAGKAHRRSYGDIIAAIGRGHQDWAFSGLGEDADLFQNVRALRDRSRDLWKTNPYFVKYREELWANVFGSKGIALRMKVKETEDRVVHSPDEKSVRSAYHQRRARIAEHFARKAGRAFSINGSMDAERAKVKIGEPDIFANTLIERRWREWHRRETATVTGRLSYHESRQIRLLSAARDGGHFIRLIRDPKINRFGFSLQHINDEWCDYNLNAVLENGNEIRMGVELDGYGKPVAYWFISRSPRDWQWSAPGLTSGPASKHVRIEARDVIHYARFLDADSTRPAPWAASVMLNSRTLGKYVEAAVVAARVGACSTTFFESQPNSSVDTMDTATVDPEKLNEKFMEMTPGGMFGLPRGVTAKANNPNNPNAEFGAFRMDMLREFCAGLPGANYNIIANDLVGVSYSSGRLGMLDERELWKLIQQFDIDTAEVPIFEAWLEMALLTGAVPLPLAKFAKFNQPHFQGRRWDWVDPKKDAEADASLVANKFTSRTRIVEEAGDDFEEILEELAMEEMLLESYGMSAMTTAEHPPVAKPGAEDDEDEGEDEDEPPKNGNGKSRLLVKVS